MKTKENIRALRKSKAMTQKELADALGVTKTTVSYLRRSISSLNLLLVRY